MYSWQKSQWQSILKRKAALPHALLLRGGAGIGKNDFAFALARTLLCSAASNDAACGACPSCIWFAEGHHPDFRLISPEDETEETATKKKISKKTQISVTQIRGLLELLSLSSHQLQGLRIIIISPAEALNITAANALLKMLEEPPANTLFLLVSSQPQRLLATITSRCQAIDMPIPSKTEALAWLEAQGAKNAQNLLDYAGGAPLLALELESQLETSTSLIKSLALGNKLDPFIAAPLFLSLGMERAIDSLQKWTFDLLNCKLATGVYYHAQHASAFQGLSKSVNLGLLMRLQQKLIEAKKTANHPLSNEMQLENILLDYIHIFK